MTYSYKDIKLYTKNSISRCSGIAFSTFLFVRIKNLWKKKIYILSN